MKAKTPQEKKVLSYTKDCRNTYGENDKSSRKNIPLRKAKVNRSYRRNVNKELNKINSQSNFENVELAESKAKNIKREDWKKSADEPLGKVIGRKLERRVNHTGNGKTAQKKAREFVENLRIEVIQETNEQWIAKALNVKDMMVYGKTSEEAIDKCKTLAGYVFLEQTGAIEKITVNENYISIFTN